MREGQTGNTRCFRNHRARLASQAAIVGDLKDGDGAPNGHPQFFSDLIQ